MTTAASRIGDGSILPVGQRFPRESEALLAIAQAPDRVLLVRSASALANGRTGMVFVSIFAFYVDGYLRMHVQRAACRG